MTRTANARPLRPGKARLLFAGVLVLLLTLVADVVLRDGLARLSDLLFDAFQRSAPRTASADPGVVVVDIDEASLQRVGQWPWPRDQIGQLVDTAGQLGAAAIAFDMVFTEPDRTSLGPQLQRLRAQGLDIRLPPQLALDNDALFAATIVRHPVVMGVAPADEVGRELPPPLAGLSFAGTDPRQYLPAVRGGLSNLPVLTAAASGLGSFSFPPAHDNIIRSMPLVTAAAGQLYPGLGVEALRVAQGASGLVLRSTDASGERGGGPLALMSVKVGALELPASGHGHLRLHYSGMPHMSVIPAWQLLQSDAARLAAKVEGRIVLVGTSAIGLRDIVATPLASAAPGVNVHAELIDQALNQQFLQRPDWARGAEVLVAVLGTLLLLLVLNGSRPLLSSAVLLGLLVAVLGGAWWAYRRHAWLLDPLPAVLCLLAVFLTLLPTLLFIGNREKRFVRSAFGRYLSPALVERLSHDAQALKLGGESRPITVLFSDIRGFTALSENLSPDALTSLLNRYLTPMTDVLLAHEATIDKYIGDAIMAFWNAPVDIAAHPRKACLAALGMVAAVDALNRESGGAIRIGIGLNTGEACVGNLGSQQRFSYSAIGDTVNLASRVEGLTKFYGVTVLVTGAVKMQATDLAFIEVDRVRVVGRSEPVVLHALLGNADLVADPAFQQYAQAHAQMLARYRAAEFDAAALALQVLREFPVAASLAALHDRYADRLEQLRAQPPAQWDGIFTATAK
ncbi:CHASE2 domain-containing protein [Stenotrophomonas pictorum]|nr:adenylate/guanylate cyclase domain-containing protein [Stenotrophomonas pictorum]